MKQDTIIRLRGHHLLCMLTWSGQGYTPAFTENFNRIAERLAVGDAVIEIVEGPDDICAPLNAGNCSGYHCLDARPAERDREALVAVTALLQTSGVCESLAPQNPSQHQPGWISDPLEPGMCIKLTPQLLNLFRTAFKTGETRKACQGCEWHDLCTGIADRDFADAKTWRV